MDTVLLWSLTGASTAIAWLLLNRAGIAVMGLTPVAVTFGLIVAFNSIGALLFYSGTISNRDLSPDVALRLALMNNVTLILFVFGVLAASRWFGPLPIVRASEVTGERRARIVAFAVFGVSLMVTLLYLSRLPTLPILSAQSGDLSGAMEARSAATNAFAGRYYLYSLFFGGVLPFIACVFLAMFLTWRRRVDGIMAVVAGLAAISVPIVLVTKSGGIRVFIMLLVVYAVSRHRPLPLGRAAAAIVGLAVILIGIYVTASPPERELETIIEMAATRLFSSQGLAAYFHLEVFPDKIDYLYGASFPNPGGLLPFDNVPLPRLVWEYAFEDSFVRALDVAGSAPAVYWAEGYANFGVLGALLSALVVGGVIYGIDWAIRHGLGATPIGLALLGWAAEHYGMVAIGSAVQFIIDPEAAVIMAIALLMRPRRQERTAVA